MWPMHWSGWKWLASIWLIAITILFLLPGSALPKETWLQQLQIDKLVHILFFGVLLFLWRFIFPGLSILLFLTLALVYGILVEIIQNKWVAYRSADPWDVVADMVGAYVGLIVWYRVYKK